MKKQKKTMPEILILVHSKRFLMNKIWNLMKNPTLTKEIQIFTC